VVRFGQWMAAGVLVSAVMMVALLLLVRLVARGPAPELETGAGDSHRGHTPLSGGERVTLTAFGLAVSLWLAPTFAALALGADHPWTKSIEQRLPEGLVGLSCGVLLFVLPAGLRPFRPALRWEQATRIDWGTLLLFGGGMSLGDMFFKTGLGDALGRAAVDLTGVSSVAGLTLLTTALAAAVSEVTSNTASASLAVPVAIALARALSLDPTIPALGAAMGSSLGLMLPVSTAPNAIVYGTGHVRLRDMIVVGVCVDAIGVLVIWAVLMTVWPLVAG